MAYGGRYFSLRIYQGGNAGKKMKLKLLATILAASAVALILVATTDQPVTAQTTTYFCGQSKDGIPTTYARTATGKKMAIIRWERAWGGQYTPEVRCQKVSAKFQQANEAGVLNYLTAGVQNGQKVVCGVRRYGDSCDDQKQILLTLRQEEEPDEVIRALIGVSYRASGPIVQSEDGAPQFYYDMSLFLREAPTEVDN
jgi:hypothetical protein